MEKDDSEKPTREDQTEGQHRIDEPELFMRKETEAEREKCIRFSVIMIYDWLLVGHMATHVITWVHKQITCISQVSREQLPTEPYIFWRRGSTREEREEDEGRWRQETPEWSTSARDGSRRNLPRCAGR